MKLLVTGAGGQLGLALAAKERPGLAVVGKTRAAMDITDPSAVARMLDEVQPDAVVNAAAFTNVDQAEGNRALAFSVNEAGPRLLARAAASARVPLIHISTDFVFDGRATQPYRPGDPTGPLNVYGASKLAGETAVLDAYPAALVIRTSWLYRLGSRNFVTSIIRLLRETGRADVVADQSGSPTRAASLAAVIVAAAERKISASDMSGIRHFADAGVTSRFDFASAIREEAVAAGLAGASARVEPAATSPDAPASRPAYSALDSGQILSEAGLQPSPWRDALRREIQAGNASPETPASL